MSKKLGPPDEAGPIAFADDIATAPAARLLELANQLPHRRTAERTSATYDGPPVDVGVDAEWVLTMRPDRQGWHNEVLCFTAVLACGEKRTRFIYYVQGRDRTSRPSLGGFVGRLIRQALADGTINAIPPNLTFYGHFLRGDLTSFSDIWRRRDELRVIGKNLVSARGGSVVDVADVSDGGGGQQRRGDDHVWVRRGAGQKLLVRVEFVDTQRLTPGRKGLAYAAGMVGRRKLDLHEDLGVPAALTTEREEMVGSGLEPRLGIRRMDLVLRDYPEAFRRYAIEDAEIALEVGLFFERFARDGLGLSRTPRSIAGGAAACIRRLHGGSEALSRLLNRGTTIVHDFNKKTFRHITKKVPVIDLGMQLQFELGREAYHGGRNECFYAGPTPEGEWFDYDLPAAYTTILAMLRPLDYGRAWHPTRADEFGVHDVGAAWIEFGFPDGTRFPSLPVRGATSLFFPLRGCASDRVVVTPPEIVTALALGAEIKILQAVIIPPASELRVFAEFTRLVQAKRREHPRATDLGLHELWKETGNSGYGLTGQGLRDKRGFDPATMKSEPIGPSALTEPFFAAFATGFCRAMIGELLGNLSNDVSVVSATTDGFLCNAPLERLRVDGPLCAAFADVRDEFFGDRKVVELKHRARQLVSISTRATYTARHEPGWPSICAKGGIKFDTAEATHNRRLLRVYLTQEYDTKIEHDQLISAREQFTREADLINVRKARRLNLRYDFKRQPIRPRMVALSSHIERLAFDTRPWVTADDAEIARIRVDGWSRQHQRLLLDAATFRDWEDNHEAFIAMRDACVAERVLVSDDLHLRQLAASQGFAQGAWLQAAARTMLGEGVLDPTSYALCVARLASLRHSHVSLEGDVLLEMLRHEHGQALIEAAGEYIGGPRAEIVSHAWVVADFMNRAWASGVSSWRAGAAASMLIDRLISKRDNWWETLELLMEMCQRTRGAGARPDLSRNYIRDWVRGHFLRKPTSSGRARGGTRSRRGKRASARS